MLGLTPDATPAQIREAYRRRARELHPDRAGGERPPAGEPASPGQVGMAEVNAAWRVLGDPQRRRSYDASLAARRAGPAPARPRTSASFPATPPVPDAAAPVPAGVGLIRALPWLLVLAVLAVVFVFTAYARSPGAGDGPAGTPTTAEAGGAGPLELGRCVADGPGGVLVQVPCAGPYDGRVTDIVPLDQPCPAGTLAYVSPADPRRICVGPR